MSDVEFWNVHRTSDGSRWCDWIHQEAEDCEEVCPAGCPDSERITWAELTARVVTHG